MISDSVVSFALVLCGIQIDDSARFSIQYFRASSRALRPNTISLLRPRNWICLYRLTKSLWRTFFIVVHSSRSSCFRIRMNSRKRMFRHFWVAILIIMCFRQSSRACFFVICFKSTSWRNEFTTRSSSSWTLSLLCPFALLQEDRIFTVSSAVGSRTVRLIDCLDSWIFLIDRSWDTTCRERCDSAIRPCSLERSSRHHCRRSENRISLSSFRTMSYSSLFDHVLVTFDVTINRMSRSSLLILTLLSLDREIYIYIYIYQ